MANLRIISRPLLSLVIIFIGCKEKNNSIEMDKVNERATIVKSGVPFGKAVANIESKYSLKSKWVDANMVQGIDQNGKITYTAWSDATDATGGNSFTITPNQDTIKCLMLICDTSFTSISTMLNVYEGVGSEKTIYKINNRVPHVWWQFGYGVLEAINNMLWYPNYNVQYTTSGFPYIVKEYLDENKKPLSKSIVVWQTKEIK